MSAEPHATGQTRPVEDSWEQDSGWREIGGWTDSAPPDDALPDDAGAAAGTCAGLWNPVVVFGDGPDSPLFGSVALPATESLSAEAALAVAECAERVVGWATAIRLRALARLEHALAHEPVPRRACQPVRLGGDEAHALAVAETAASAAVSEAAAARLLHDAADLTGPGAQVLTALQDGQISFQHARVILDQARTLPPGQTAGFAREALGRTVTRAGRRRTPAELRSNLRTFRERSHPESIQARKKAATRERGVWFAPEPDGMCTLSALLPAEAGLALYNGLDADARAARAAHTAARSATAASVGARADEVAAGAEPSGARGHGAEPSGARGLAAEERTLSQLRADALVHRLLGSPDPAFPGSFRPHITLTIPVCAVLPTENPATPNPAADDRAAENRSAETRAGEGSTVEQGAAERRETGNGAAEDDSHEVSPAGSGFAELEGYGPIDAPTARRLASLAPNWDRLYTDWDTGVALGIGRRAYRPPKALRSYLAHRDGGCTFPGCTRTPRACEPDHTVEWQDGGRTDPENLALLCPRHHAIKSIGAWTYHHTTAKEPGGIPQPRLLEWTSPLGRTYMVEASAHLVDAADVDAAEVDAAEVDAAEQAGARRKHSAVPVPDPPEQVLPQRDPNLPRSSQPDPPPF
ncbi:HNH endonuclease signature motif containing protein [Sinomonas susongensis]|uniref:HNH endonuclease signature motif containing protein n=1 Tax=Sinomonas susongensis TaxID=1324851 RepID=UPI001485FE5D|nr:HNH endonuclease signature motif containing protein [Sinomonas susongensis]